MIQFIYGKPKGGPLVSGRDEEWEWSRRGGDYKNHRDFFTIHWEVQTSKPNEVRFHVESPIAEVDHKLNDIKNNIVSRFIRDDIKEAILSAGFEYKIGYRISEKCIRRYKSTEPFRIIMPNRFDLLSAEKNIEQIHEFFKRTIHSAVEPYLIRLQEEFGK
ncbi:hypothetical protein EST62_07640 [Chlorobaculum sp. 24CR]|uniref:hypothetical protein n=1 Tax=Chlorobaculum sp. 24CR TaxID=2508878 RepID=UPI00100AC5B7|nr:hypothetical protein [Chlorobaculum sp. 24CR]RXK85146.1 hypothetical protein EST62_07640 [Chlorobaculum sp. 24CR]